MKYFIFFTSTVILFYFLFKKENFEQIKNSNKKILLKNEVLFVGEKIEDQTFIFELNNSGIKYYNKWSNELIYTKNIPSVYKMIFEDNHLNFYNDKNEIIDFIEIMYFNEKMIYLTINDGFIKISDEINLNQFLVNEIIV